MSPISPACRGSIWRAYLLFFSLFLCTLATPNDLIRRKEVEVGTQRILALQDSQGIKTSSVLERNHSQSLDTLPAILDALEVMQEDYFDIWQGIWPSAIDWTSAVMGTHVVAALSTLSRAFSYNITSGTKIHENTINRYFSQLVASYFGQNAFGLRGQAYDDMLWVVLGWLESIKFIDLHSSLHYPSPHFKHQEGAEHMNWYGQQWIPSFAHRARIFWELASQGWDETLCSGGMLWSPYLKPYKNAITNELFITASISMYLYFPGDENTSPFGVMEARTEASKPYDPKYLAAAVNAYKWLMDSNMTDSKGLFVDGYHVTGWRRGKTDGPKKCDLRNEMVYTYNQGVLLSGQRGLWEATGARSYLEEGHNLIASVITATGYDLKHNKVHDETFKKGSKLHLGEWYGIGRSGILEDACDSGARCSQDSQTFKGIFFHHLTLFCTPLPAHLRLPQDPMVLVEESLKSWHEEKCASYSAWISRNAEAAKGTANRKGRYGTWWGAPKDVKGDEMERIEIPPQEVGFGAVDYRSLGVPRDGGWRDDWAASVDDDELVESERVEGELRRRRRRGEEGVDGEKDLNDRGRGRTVETQSGGISVLRATWELVDRRLLEQSIGR